MASTTPKVVVETIEIVVVEEVEEMVDKGEDEEEEPDTSIQGTSSQSKTRQIKCSWGKSKPCQVKSRHVKSSQGTSNWYKQVLGWHAKSSQSKVHSKHLFSLWTFTTYYLLTIKQYNGATTKGTKQRWDDCLSQWTRFAGGTSDAGGATVHTIRRPGTLYAHWFRFPYIVGNNILI